MCQGGASGFAVAGVGAFGAVWLGVAGAVSERADVWECEGGLRELCGVSFVGGGALVGVGDVSVVE